MGFLDPGDEAIVFEPFFDQSVLWLRALEYSDTSSGISAI